MRWRVLILILFQITGATVARADACANQFRAGFTVYDRVDAVLTRTEEALYFGLGWVNRERVMDQLENRSAVTTACEEARVLHDDLARARAQLGDANQAFRLAGAFCLGENRRRAQDNIARIGGMAQDLDAQIDYLLSLRERCRG